MSSASELSEAERIRVEAFGLDKPEVHPQSDREEIIRILDIEGAQTGECGHEPGEVEDCENGCRELLEEYADALIAAGFSRAQAVSLPDRKTLIDVFRKTRCIATPRLERGYCCPVPEEAERMAEAVLAALSTQPAAGGAQLIAAERERQITEEGYTAEKDNGHASDLAQAARSYIEEARYQIGDGPGALQDDWPWEDRFWKPTGNPVRDLTKAGALIAAAIDSLLAAPELFPGTLAALDRLSIRPEVQA